jgi:hypothetical protein
LLLACASKSEEWYLGAYICRWWCNFIPGRSHWSISKSVRVNDDLLSVQHCLHRISNLCIHIFNNPTQNQLDRTKSWRTLSEFENSALIFVSSLSVELTREKPLFWRKSVIRQTSQRFMILRGIRYGKLYRRGRSAH